MQIDSVCVWKDHVVELRFGGVPLPCVGYRSASPNRAAVARQVAGEVGKVLEYSEKVKAE